MSRSSNNVEESWAATGGPLFPTTSEIGFLEAKQDAVVETFAAWRTSLDQRPETRLIAGGLNDGIRSLFPLTTVDRRRWVFFDVGGWTAFFDNGARGTDASPVASYLAQAMGCRGLRVVAVPDGGGCYGATILEIYGPEMTEFLNYVRTISATNNAGTWRFDIGGEPQAFENVTAYARRKIKDRFTVDMLAEYSGALGVNAFDPSEYHTPILVERKDAEPESMKELTLAQARARFIA